MVRVAYDQGYSRAKVWDVKKEAYVWIAPIDAREGLVHGTIAPYAPGDEPETFGDGEKNWVNLVPAEHLHK